jgi:transposase
MGYTGAVIKNLVEQMGYVLEVVKRPRKWCWVPNEITDVTTYLAEQGIEIPQGFKVLPKRWVVERTFAWLSRYRRMSKDYEYLCNTSEAFIFAALSRTMVKRLIMII